MTSDPQPPFRNVFSDEEARYIINNAGEISHVLRTMMRKSTLVTAYFNGSSDFVLTSVLAADDRNSRVILDAPQQKEDLQKILRAQHAMCVASEDGVGIKFPVAGLKLHSHQGSAALAAPLPDSLLRMQRREFYRAACPLGESIKCRVPATVDNKASRVEVVVLDISCGGIALLDNQPQVSFEKAAQFRGCEIDLPGVGMIVSDLVVCDSFEITLKNNTVSRRSGCRFLNVTPAMAGMIQRYIMQLERDRNPRFGGR
ncbi:MAG TPA: flagellar brake protein [Burkholderiales bacterium]|nr:flagellar brake protein [Burkholderiales bacterium]